MSYIQTTNAFALSYFTSVLLRIFKKSIFGIAKTFQKFSNRIVIGTYYRCAYLYITNVVLKNISSRRRLRFCGITYWFITVYSATRFTFQFPFPFLLY